MGLTPQQEALVLGGEGTCLFVKVGESPPLSMFLFICGVCVSCDVGRAGGAAQHPAADLATSCSGDRTISLMTLCLSMCPACTGGREAVVASECDGSQVSFAVRMLSCTECT